MILMHNIPVLLSLALFVLVVWLGGYAVGSALALISSVKQGDRILLAFPTGAAALGWIAFCAGEFGNIPITPSFIYVVSLSMAGIGAAWGVKHLRDGWSRRGGLSIHDESPEEPPGSQWTWLAWVELTVILLLMLRQILESWTQPIIFSDSVIHHLPFAKIVYQTHALPRYADPQGYALLFATSPLALLHFASAWLWLQKIYLFAPCLITILFGGHLCALFYRFARRLLDVRPHAALGAVLILLLPADRLLIDLLGWGTSLDVPYAFWGVATVYFLLMQIQERQGRWWLWSGICGAMACWTKAFGFEFVPAFAGACVIEWGLSRWERRPDANALLYATLKLGVVLGFVLAPFLLRNWIRWGNPVYPFLSSLFGGYLTDTWAAMASAFNASVPTKPLSIDYPRVFARILGYPPILLTALFFIHPIFRRRSAVRLIYLSILFQVLIYMSYRGYPVVVGGPDTASYIRYLFPATLLLGVFVACLLDQERYPVDRWFVYILIGAFIIQVARTYYEIVRLGIYTIPSFTDLNSFKAMGYERLPLIIAGGFLCTILLSRWGTGWVTGVRISILCSGCLLFSYIYPITRPWSLFSGPLQRPAVDWTAVPFISPYGEWVHKHLPESAVFLTNEYRLWIVPRPVINGDSPLLYEGFRPDASIEDKLGRLAELGVTHIIAYGKNGAPYPLKMYGSKQWDFLNEPGGDRYFKEIYRGPQIPPSQDPVGFSFAETYVYEIRYPPHLQRVTESHVPRPWLYDYAATGILKSSPLPGPERSR